MCGVAGLNNVGPVGVADAVPVVLNVVIAFGLVKLVRAQLTLALTTVTPMFAFAKLASR